MKLNKDTVLTEAHDEMKATFNDYVQELNGDLPTAGISDKMINVLETYSKLFKCSMDQAYDRLRETKVA